ncbi:hypothetical protein GGD65_004559 [Bradyrhizobium sp. CIR18]|nr:hypothetical protein [Bradyrhizobium sp. CIR18]
MAISYGLQFEALRDHRDKIRQKFELLLNLCRCWELISHARGSPSLISELVQDDEVHPGQMLGKPALPSVAGLGLQTVDEVDHIVEAATGT